MLYKQLLPCVCIHTHRRIPCQPPTYTRTELTSWITLSTDQAHPAFLSKCSGPAWLPWHDLFNGSCLGVCRVSKSFMIVLLPRHALLLRERLQDCSRLNVRVPNFNLPQPSAPLQFSNKKSTFSKSWKDFPPSSRGVSTTERTEPSSSAAVTMLQSSQTYHLPIKHNTETF